MSIHENSDKLHRETGGVGCRNAAVHMIEMNWGGHTPMNRNWICLWLMAGVLLPVRGDVAPAAQAKWKEVWKEITLIKKDHPFAVSGSYVSPGSKYLQKYSPDQKLEVLMEDKPGFK